MTHKHQYMYTHTQNKIIGISSFSPALNYIYMTQDEIKFNKTNCEIQVCAVSCKFTNKYSWLVIISGLMTSMPHSNVMKQYDIT